jgi:hypothetical protein
MNPGFIWTEKIEIAELNGKGMKKEEYETLGEGEGEGEGEYLN